ncbi:Ger(x)C family spore germination protein [Paenibacillus sp. T1]|uniref:Ger(X)C family spore germination protein n=2 Tax=Paenibacillus glycinis TaxID=2697035 RepID=A0ABW9XN76_9BACL|nr:Ger(x)C family spore germination protein [Paenibacillus glycinis]
MMLMRMVAVVLLFLLSGCWDNKDINHRSLPIAMGVSYNQGSYTIYLDIPSVTEDEEKIQIISDHGDSINEVIDHISMNMESQVDLLHLKVILVDKAFAKHGLSEGIASIIRSRYIAPKTMFVICDEPLDHFFQHIDASSTDDGTAIYDYFQKNAGWSPDIAYTPTWRIFRSIHSYTNDVVIPMIKSGDSTVIKSTGSAIMKNGKMVGKLTNEETLLYNVFNGVNTQGKIEVMGHATVQIVSSRIGNRSSLEQDQPRLRSTVHLKITVMDTRGNPSMVLIKKELQELVTREFMLLFQKVQKAGADVFGLGQHFRDDLTRPQLARWRTDYLPNMKVDLHVKTIVRNTGNLKARK